MIRLNYGVQRSERGAITVVRIAGGLVVSASMLGISPVQYLLETKHAVGLNDLFLGVFMGFVFGVLVALTGCMRGVHSGRSASAVGEATTSAVVTGIVSMSPLRSCFGVRPTLTAGLLASALSVAWLTRLPVDGSYFWDLFPAFEQIPSIIPHGDGHFSTAKPFSPTPVDVCTLGYARIIGPASRRHRGPR